MLLWLLRPQWLLRQLSPLTACPTPTPILLSWHCRVPNSRQDTHSLRVQGPGTHSEVTEEEGEGGGIARKTEGPQGTLKSDSEAISSSSSLVAEEAEIRVCCWLEVTRCGLLISP